MRRAGQALGSERLLSPGLPHGTGATWWGRQPGPGGGLLDFKLTCLSHTSAFHFTLHCLCSSKLPEPAFCPWENQLDSQAGWSRAQPLPSLPRDPQAFSHQHLLRTSVLSFVGNYPNSIVTAMTGTLLF